MFHFWQIGRFWSDNFRIFLMQTTIIFTLTQMKILQYLNVGGAELISHVRDRKSMKVSFYGKIQTFLAKIF